MVGSDARADRDANGLQATTQCNTLSVHYALAARLRLEDTPFGAGNGVYDIGPGSLDLRLTRGGPGAPVKVDLLSYAMRDRFTVESNVLFIHAKIETHTETRVAPDERGVAATGTLRGSEVDWSTTVRGYRADGTVHCEGSGCGFSGVPPSGTTPLHIGPGPVKFERLVFGSSTFDTVQMDFTRVAHTEMPRQTAFVTFAGRKMTEQCLDK